MIPTVLGLPGGTGRWPAHNAIQKWLAARDVGTYLPQSGETASTNLVYDWDWRAKRLKWNPEVWQLLFNQPGRTVYNHGQYFYRFRPDTVRCEGWKSQLDMTNAELVETLSDIRLHIIDQGFDGPEMVIDEPPHFALDGGDGTLFGWSPKVEAGIIKFVGCAVEAGWPVWVITPHPAGVEFWRDRIHPSGWYLAATSYDRWLQMDLGVPCGLYNADTYDGLGEKLKRYPRYLQWTCLESDAQVPTPILFEIAADRTTFTPTAAAYQLLDELAKAEAVEPPVEPDTGIAEQLDAIEAAVARLRIMLESPRT